MGLPITRMPEETRPKLGAFLRTRFITGLLVMFPLVVTIFFGRFLFDLIDRWADPISRRLFDRVVPGFGAVSFLLTVLLLGMLAHNVIGRRMLRLGDRLLARIPVLRPIYRGARELTRAIGRDRTASFSRVALIPFPNESVWSVGFVTGEFDDRTAAGTQRMVTVFMPTCPNPTTGFFLVYPVTALKSTDLSVEEALRMVISGGLVGAVQDRLFPGSRPQAGDSR
jgi:uncharacterized membrane protein